MLSTREGTLEESSVQDSRGTGLKPLLTVRFSFPWHSPMEGSLLRCALPPSANKTLSGQTVAGWQLRAPSNSPTRHASPCKPMQRHAKPGLAALVLARPFAAHVCATDGIDSVASIVENQWQQRMLSGCVVTMLLVLWGVSGHSSADKLSSMKIPLPSVVVCVPAQAPQQLTRAAVASQATS